MAERWQQWMPFHIDRWRGSPDVRAMHPAARMGYLELLCSCWQSAKCNVSNDPVDLATASGLGDELWLIYGPRILRKFVLVDGMLRNEVVFAEWDEARRVYEKRKSGAVRTNSSRSADGERTQSPRNTDTQTLTGTLTTTKEQKQKTLASTANAVPAERGKFLGSLPLNDKSEYAIHEDDLQRDVGLYPAVDVRQAYRDMKGWLLADTRRCKTRRGIRKFMNSWLSREQDKGRTTPQTQARGNKFDELRRKIDEGFFDEKDCNDGGTAGSAAAVG